MSQKNKPVVLCVDDEPTNLKFIKEILKNDYQVYLAPSGERALIFLRLKIPDIILLDVEMPRMSGYDVIRELKGNPVWEGIPVVFLTGLEGRDNEEAAFVLGAVDYILKPISAGVLKARVKLHIELEAYRRNLEELVDIRTQQLTQTQDCILDVLANVTSYRDQETGGHIKRTTYYTEVIVDLLMENPVEGYIPDEDYAVSMIKSARLHDIGKVAVPDSILLKPGKLTAAEFNAIKLHTIYGAQLIDNAMTELGETSSFLDVAREIIIGHHERWNGAGYPNGLSGTDIPLSARLMAIVDVYDALISHRPYKEPFSHETAIDIIVGDAGTHFDPKLIEICKPIFYKFKEVAESNRDDSYASYLIDVTSLST